MGASGSPRYPHLHYQLLADSGLFSGDGLPVQFENVVTGTACGNSQTRYISPGAVACGMIAERDNLQAGDRLAVDEANR